MSILFIGAHPDDIELGCGGTICYYIERKYEVYCYHLTNGVYTDINDSIIRNKDEILETTLKSLNTLGVKKENIFFTDVNATELKVNKKMISELQKLILMKKVNTVYTHPDPDTYHQDHRAAHNITMAGARRYVNNIFTFELMFNFAGGLMIPNYYIDISKYIDKKMKSLRYHTTEFEKYGGEKWIESFVSLAKYRGMQVNTKYAEAFYVMKYLLR